MEAGASGAESDRPRAQSRELSLCPLRDGHTHPHHSSDSSTVCQVVGGWTSQRAGAVLLPMVGRGGFAGYVCLNGERRRARWHAQKAAVVLCFAAMQVVGLAHACNMQGGRCLCETADGDHSWDLTDISASEITTTGDTTGCAHREAPPSRWPHARPTPHLCVARQCAHSGGGLRAQARRARAVGTITFSYVRT